MAADCATLIKNHVDASNKANESLITQAKTLLKMLNVLFEVVKQGGCIYSCGNGGSACDAMHLTEELVARYLRERPGIRAQHLLDSGTITCWANDYDFASVFERQIQTHLNDKDCLIVFSTSGNSENILRALQAAKKQGAKTIALLGRDGGKAKALSDLSLVVDSQTTAHIQESHITAVHILCDQLEQKLFL